ncbi:MAG: tetratricopeptide repeat protein [Pelagimonas sp.]|uniref:tetratricopeptide repeat protein n=1 Tax=Pelagimonas sp. TaxID=2073170 RepID=UPI003D6A6A64
MSNPESFIEEVTEEVRRDRTFKFMKRYGWIGVVVVLGIVGGTAWREYQNATQSASAQAFGDGILTALESDDSAARVTALDKLEAKSADGQAVLDMLIAAEEGSAGDDAAAIERLQAISNNADIPTIYRQIASYKALARGAEILSVEDRQSGFEALAVAGQPLRLLAEEQLALIEIESGDKDAALTRLQALIIDSEVTSGLRRRASQLIVALGGAVEQS